MGMVMAALIESAEQTAARQRRDARLSAALQVAQPAEAASTAARPEPSQAALREDAIRKQMAVRDEPL